jgi:hypothetical protein
MQANVNPLVFLIAFLLLAGAVDAIIAAVLFFKRKAQSDACDRVQGEIVELVAKDTPKGRLYHPYVRYSRGNGKEEFVESAWGSGSANFKAGERVDVLIDRRDPGKVSVAGGMKAWLLPLFFALGALSSALIAVVLFAFMQFAR